jgi:hypothetical protein
MTFVPIDSMDVAPRVRGLTQRPDPFTLGLMSSSLHVALATLVLAALAAAGCSSGSTGGIGDGGLDGSVTSTTDSGTDGSTSTDDGGSSSGDASSLASCTRQADLDTDCARVYGAAAPNGYTCSDVFLHTPPCQPLMTRGCTEICSNRCCP